MAGRFCRQINAKRLILSHFSPRYRGDPGLDAMRIMWRLEDLAREESGLSGR
jgi:ribonuclease Z